MRRSRSRRTAAAAALLALSSLPASTSAQSSGQPYRQSTGDGTFEIVGNSGVSAQQIFLGTPDRVYIIDKVENNPLRVGGHAAWASEYNLINNTVRAMDVVTNTFCAGGNVLGDGTWINIGGNQEITYGGETVNNTSEDLYQDKDGQFAVRFLNTCEDSTCNWVDNPKNYMSSQRWYPSIETLEDGSVIIVGGNFYGGYVSASDNNNPTYEFWPRRDGGAPIGLNILAETLPANLYPSTYLLPSGNLFLSMNWASEVFDYKNNVEYPGPPMPHAVRTYPGSAANCMLPLTPANNWTATIIFCGGTDLSPSQWNPDKTILVDVPASASCVRITPDVDNTFSDDDSLPDGRVMPNFILLPNGKLFLVNGANQGTAGYGNQSFAIGHSYSTTPLYTPLMYDPEAAAGSRFSSEGLSASTIPRLYHSTATLLPDGSIFIAGSNPNPDVITDEEYPTEWRVERFYPAYYSKTRPVPEGIPANLTYGGEYFNITLSDSDLGSDPQSALDSTTVVVMRMGFSTHAVNFGQRYLQLNSTYSYANGTATLHVSELPPNPAIFAPGPAYVFVVVDGIPSMGQEVMVGSGVIEDQNTTAAVELPGVFFLPPATPTPTQQGKSKSGDLSVISRTGLVGVAATLLGVALGALLLAL